MKLVFSLFLLIVGFVDSTNAYISSVPSGGTIPWTDKDKSSFVQPPSSVEVDDIFREEYNAWAKLYGKSTSDETRFENFKVNFMLQMQQNKKTGIYSHLNEFGDMTAKEYESGKYADSATKAPKKKSSDNVVEVELIIDEEPMPRVRPMDSRSHSGETSNHAKPWNPQHRTSRSTEKFHDASTVGAGGYSSVRNTGHSSYSRPYVYSGPNKQHAPQQPKVYRQDQVIEQPSQPRRKRRLVRCAPNKFF